MVEAPEGPEPPEPPGSPTGRPEKPKNRTLEWFSKNPVFGLIGFLIGIVSLAATVYFGWASLKSRDLSLTVNPTRTTIVKAGQSSDLHVLYKGQSVATDVTGLQVGIWNAGRESIRPEQILSPIILQTSPKVPILEVRLRHTSRPVCGIVLDGSHLEDGKVGVSWRILEHNDGAVVQFIVAGPSKTTVVGQGSVEADERIEAVTFAQRSDVFLGWRFLLMFLGGCLAGTSSILVPFSVRPRSRSFRRRYRLLLVASLLLLVLVGTAIVLVYIPTPLQFD